MSKTYNLSCASCLCAGAVDSGLTDSDAHGGSRVLGKRLRLSSGIEAVGSFRGNVTSRSESVGDGGSTTFSGAF